MTEAETEQAIAAAKTALHGVARYLHFDDDEDKHQARALSSIDSIVDQLVSHLGHAQTPADEDHPDCAQSPIDPCPYAIDGCILENDEIGPCLCANAVSRPNRLPEIPGKPSIDPDGGPKRPSGAAESLTGGDAQADSSQLHNTQRK